ncbi:hypothetical protein FQ142_15970 [Microbacterium sp. ANT_H45B]|uniref:tetratricopeptide repeat protein n=1 Tax=Microbacterium sp. ANT_H45B TaxID=2597346 RepID=UPI0011EDCE49|nr:tetratricopeptide repeat protein [Microbacterium sp. ANT_H45B]KAA0960321.1 hypothetical protein FQ142_15970 [Microbacterium sp. ANT_H45B]
MVTPVVDAADAFTNGRYLRFLELVRDDRGRYDLSTVEELIPLAEVPVRELDGKSPSSALLMLGRYVWDVDERLAIAMFCEAAEAGAEGASAILGESLTWMGDHAEAVERLVRALERGEGNPSRVQGLLGESLWKGGEESEVGRIEALLRAGMESSSEFGIPLARLMLQQERDDEAASLLTDLVDAGVYGAALLLGNVLSHSPGTRAAARAAYLAGIASGDAHSAHNLAAMLLEQGDEDGARHYHRRAQVMGDHSALGPSSTTDGVA